MTFSSFLRTTTLKRGVFHCLRIECNNTIAQLPAVVLPGVRFKVPLKMSWIKLAGVCLNVVKRCMFHKCWEHAYWQLPVSEVSLHPTKNAVYANERFLVPPGGQDEMRAAPFDQGHLGASSMPKLPRV